MMQAKRRLIGLLATLMSIGAFLVSPVVANLDSYHDIGIRTGAYGTTVALITAPYAAIDSYHDI
jgi:hypothetical protein